MVTRLLFWLLLAVLLGSFVILGGIFRSTNGPTFDEPVHLVAGHSYWATGDFRINIEDPPLPKLLWALPGILSGKFPFQPTPELWNRNDQWRLGNEFVSTDPDRSDQLLRPARSMNTLFGLGTMAMLGYWVWRLWRSRACVLLAIALFVLDPTCVALSNILSSDMALTFFTLASSYGLWAYARQPSSRNLLVLGLCLGGLLSSKFSAVVVIVGLLAAVLVHLIRGGSFVDTAESLKERWLSALTPGVRITIIALLTLAATYGFLRFPDWGVGLKQQMVRAETGDPHYYLLGEIRTRGFFWYFPACLVWKLPEGTLLLIALGLTQIHRDRDWPFLVIPPLVFFTGMMASGVNLGVRIVLPVVPFLFLLGAGFVRPGPRLTLRIALAVILLALTLALATFPSLEQPISYMNRLIPTEARWQYLGDSNLDWGQHRVSEEWLGPGEVYISIYGPAPLTIPDAVGVLPGYGRIEPLRPYFPPRDASWITVMISYSNLQGIYLPDPQTYAFLRERTPDSVYRGSLVVYRMRQDDPLVPRIRALALNLSSP